jgi:hypothetical protein
MGQYSSSKFSIVEPCGHAQTFQAVNKQTGNSRKEVHNQNTDASRVQEEVPLDPLEVHHETGPTPSLGPTKLIPEAAAKPWRSHGMSIPRHNTFPGTCSETLKCKHQKQLRKSLENKQYLA